MRVLVVYPYANMHTNPTMSGLLARLAQGGLGVDVLCEGGGFSVEPGESPGDMKADGSFPLLNPLRRSGALPVRVLERLRLGAVPFLLRRDKRYKAVIAVDPEGLAMAHKLNARARLPLVYVSFEILFRNELTPQLQSLKAAEEAACADVCLALVQDEERAAKLLDNTPLTRDVLMMVPNAPEPAPVPRSNLLRKRLGLSDSKRIVLYSGSISAWASMYLFEEMVRGWDERFVLVLHSRSRVSPQMSLFLDELEDTGKICISREPLPLGQLPELYASADYGLAPYMAAPGHWTSGQNVQHIGFSSGKVGYYAMCGLPMLLSGIPVFTTYAPQYGFGEVYHSVTETGVLLERMDAAYNGYSAGSRRFYDACLNPGKALDAFAARVGELAC